MEFQHLQLIVGCSMLMLYIPSSQIIGMRVYKFAKVTNRLPSDLVVEDDK